MIKIICLVKRREDVSREHFIHYWENNHSRIGQAVYGGRAARYYRRYLRPMGHPSLSGGAAERDFDAIMEIWFENADIMAEAFDLVKDTSIGEYVLKDELNIFDTSALRMFYVEDADEMDTDLAIHPRRTLEEAEAFLGIER